MISTDSGVRREMAEAVGLDGHWWQTTGWLSGHCQFDHQVRKLEVVAVGEQVPRFIPAPLDLHVHGGGGSDCMEGPAAIRQMLRTHAETGTGALLATSVTATLAQVDTFLESAAEVLRDPRPDEALLFGVHLEGPFINPDRLGAQPPQTTPICFESLQRWLASGIVRVMTVAPELDGFDELLRRCEAANCRVQIGHTNCDWHTATMAFEGGCGVTHLFNAMSGFSHRDGGAATAAMANAEYAEIITDGVHVEQPAFQAACRAIPRLYSVTDATSAAGMPDGHYRLGELDVRKRGNLVLLADGTLAGSCLTQLDSLKLLRRWGLDWHRIALMCSYYPARWIRQSGYGLIEPGASVDWLEIRSDEPVAIWRSGVRNRLA